MIKTDLLSGSVTNRSKYRRWEQRMYFKAWLRATCCTWPLSHLFDESCNLHTNFGDLTLTVEAPLAMLSGRGTAQLCEGYSFKFK